MAEKQQQPKATKKPRYTFEVIRGNHMEGTDENGRGIIYQSGDKIETDKDLVSLFNRLGSKKFELLEDRNPSKD